MPQGTILSRIADRTVAEPSAVSPQSISGRSPRAPRRAGGLASTWSIQEELHAERFRDGLWHLSAAASGMAGLAEWAPSKSRASAYLRQRLHRFKCAILYCEPSVDPLEIICRNLVACGGHSSRLFTPRRLDVGLSRFQVAESTARLANLQLTRGV